MTFFFFCELESTTNEWSREISVWCPSLVTLQKAACCGAGTSSTCGLHSLFLAGGHLPLPLMSHLSSLLQHSVCAHVLSSGNRPSHFHFPFNQASSLDICPSPCCISLSPWPVLNSPVAGGAGGAGLVSLPSLVSFYLYQVQPFLASTEEGDGPGTSRYSQCTRKCSPKPGYFILLSAP